MTKHIGSNKARQSKGEPWWIFLNEECPITLEILSTLPYPPFSLTSGGITSYFDGLALASYIVSRGIFQNPLTREDLTMSDCRRLDDYLEAFCYDDSNNHHRRQLLSGTATSRKISVAEAFGLRASVHVDQTHSHPNQSRAQALQNTATAALAGLFVYGNDRRGRLNSSHRQEEDSPPSVMPATLPREDQLILDWGFDLSRSVDDSSAEFAREGWTVIDDDEALVVATQREAYQAAQNAFPRLHVARQNDDAVENDAPTSTNATEHHGIDEHIVGRARELAIHEEQDMARRERQLELARQRMLQEALARREERQRQLRQQLAEGAAQCEKKKQEHEEIQRARAEIEQWRDEQWKKLSLVSEARQKALGKEKEKKKNVDETSSKTKDSEEETDNDAILVGATPEELEEEKKAKAAAKRKRGKERKKAKKAEERAAQEKLLRLKELETKKAASASQCGACGQGILDCGFERYGKKFCSPKCARSAKPP